ncbi:translation initiation factor IF-2 [Calorimonas adulescens]|uniref:Translation initiation factor IF-2 n=1 Tax=Calorimonas adulescens TaxID=2606906 RepID=A0A5D8QFL7_9THEO|nr:translation initiation factor IF-2 [Calorimonas adulescens]TZE83312.1 translation initiation factor IF-2 [Calorimonas adulescens]
MGKIRVYELSKELGISSKDLIKHLIDLGIDVKNHMSTLENTEVEMIRDLFNVSKQNIDMEEDGSKNKGHDNYKNKLNKGTDMKKGSNVQKAVKTIKIPSSISIKELSELLGIKVNDILKFLLSHGISSNINSNVDFETATMIGAKYNIEVILEEQQDIESIYLTEEPDREDQMEPRPPIVTVMGHVDHGKTTLLDAIRKTNVTSSEAGGITQHIGAYTVELNNRKIVFIDTPGHEAFTAMRARGAQITDIVILVVAADDGVMPQTIEAINHAKAANVPIIVAVNKIDKPNANAERVKQELSEYGLIPEEWGGDTIFVPVSALRKQGINELLEMILLLSDLLELKANPNKRASGVVIESRLDKGMGSVATVLVQSGTLKVGDIVISGTSFGRVRALIDDKGRRVKKATPSIPVSVLGLSEVPNVGDKFYVVPDEKIAKAISDYRKDRLRQQQYNNINKLSFDQLFNQIQEGKIKNFNIILKGDVQGSLEAIKQSLLRLSNDEVHLNIIHDGVGAISETDVMLASASNAIIIGFNVAADAKARTLATKEKVEIRIYRVIYDLLDDIGAAIKGMLAPKVEEIILGRAEVRQVFKVPGAGMIAGSYVLEGKVTRNAQVRIIRNGTIINDDRISSLKRFKDDVREVAQGYECGIGLERFNDIKVGDILEIYAFEEIPR